MIGRRALKRAAEAAPWLLNLRSDDEVGKLAVPRPRPLVERIDDARQIYVEHRPYHAACSPPVWPLDASARWYRRRATSTSRLSPKPSAGSASRVALTHDPEEIRVKAWIVRHLRMKRRGEQWTLAHRNDVAFTGVALRLKFRQYLDTLANIFDQWPANEDRVIRLLAQSWNRRSVSKLSRCEPKALRRVANVHRRQQRLPCSALSVSRDSRIIPAQVPQTGVPAAIRWRSGCTSS